MHLAIAPVRMGPGTKPDPAALVGLVYPRPNMCDFTLDDNELELRCPLDLGRHRIHPYSDLGALDSLPLEVLSNILVQTDLRSLTNFRSVNQRANQVVDSIPEFQAIVKQSPAPLRGILSIETGYRISCRDLFRTLCTAECEECGDFGGYISLLTCSRVCFLCFCENPKYLPLSGPEVMRAFGVPHGVVASLPGMRSVRGRFSPSERKCRERLALIDVGSARDAAVAFHGSITAMEQHVAEVASKRTEDYQVRLSKMVAGGQGPKPRQPPATIARDTHSSNPRRFMAICRAPSIQLSAMAGEWGFHCIACRGQYYSRPWHWRRKYTAETFAEHIQQCGPIVRGSHHSSAV